MDTPALRILDASLNRAAEGLRVVEDFTRFALDDRFLTEQAKRLRHDLAKVAATTPLSEQLSSRETQADVGSTVATPSEGERGDAWQVAVASLERVKQSLRSIEEYGKLASPEFGAAVEALRYRFYTLEKAVGTTHGSRKRLSGVRLCVLIDGGGDAAAFATLVRTLVAAFEGAGMLQLRDKRLPDRLLVERARELVRATRGSQTLAIINDRPDLAAATHADGVHLGQDDMTVKDARGIIGPRGLIGVSTHGIDQVRQAVLGGADYLGAGPTFPSQTKTFDAFPGLDYLSQIAAETTLPTFAIGGINQSNADQVLATGISRLAVSAAVTGAADPAAAVKSLRESLEASWQDDGTESSEYPGKP